MFQDHLFSDKEICILCEVFQSLVKRGGPLDRVRFLHICHALGEGKDALLDARSMEAIFDYCDQDGDGLLNCFEWISLAAILFRADKQELVTVYQHAPPESPCNNDPEPDTPPTETVIQEDEVKKGRPTVHLKLITGNEKPCKPKIAKKYFHQSDLSDKEASLVINKTTALNQMKIAITDKGKLKRLWKVVSKERSLLSAWSLKKFPTGTLIKTTDAIAKIQRRGHITTPHSHDGMEEWLKYERLQDAYSKMGEKKFTAKSTI